MTDSENYYTLLGLLPTASAREIKQAYRTLAKRHHPDHNHGDPSAKQRFLHISEAYAVLQNARARAEYDATLRHHDYAHGTHDDFVAAAKEKARHSPRTDPDDMPLRDATNFRPGFFGFIHDVFDLIVDFLTI